MQSVASKTKHLCLSIFRRLLRIARCWGDVDFRLLFFDSENVVDGCAMMEGEDGYTFGANAPACVGLVPVDFVLALTPSTAMRTSYTS